jgi:hypothetical protein
MDKDFKYLAIYFRMGMYNKDDAVSSDLIGFDCPFDDSPVLYAKDEKELEQKIKGVYVGDLHNVVDLQTERDWDGADWEGIYPDVICDNKGEIPIDLYQRITSQENFHPDTTKYSFGKENLSQFWEREKYRWI